MHTFTANVRHELTGREYVHTFAGKFASSRDVRFWARRCHLTIISWVL
jgi:hypothetical protein